MATWLNALGTEVPRISLGEQSWVPAALQTFTSTAHSSSAAGNLALQNYTFPFLRLPAEIRNIIYRLVCRSEHGYIFVYHHSVRPGIYNVKDNALRQSLLQSCRQIQDEAGGMYWSVNEFICIDTTVLYQFLKAIGRRPRRQIRSLSVLRIHPPAAHATAAFKYMHAMENLKTLSFYFFPNGQYPYGVLQHLSEAAKAALFRLRGLERVRIEIYPYIREEPFDQYQPESMAKRVVATKAEVELCATLTQPRQMRQRPAK